MLPTRNEAKQLLVWAHECNRTVPWVKHSEVVARVAETIAEKCGLDTHRAYVSGLLHDIGRFEGVRTLHHVYAGYELLKNKGFNQVAEICMTHTFPYQDIRGHFGENDCTPEETEIITSFLQNKTYNDYDKLIQFSDAIGWVEGVCLLEVRFMNAIRRYGLAGLTVNTMEALFGLKEYFDKLCDMNIYDLFYDEIREVSFR